MSVISEFFQNIRNTEGLKTLISGGGYLTLAAIVFAETGLLIGFFLPGDSLLVVAGVLASTTGLLNIWVLNVLLIAMAIIGDFVGYQIGRKTGPALFKRPESMFFKPKYLNATQEFYDKHGGKTIVLARFMPFVRTFAPVVAGIGQMPYSQFVRFNVIGAVSWVVSMTWLGYILGTRVDPKRIEHIVYLIIIVSVAPVAIGAIRTWLKNRREAREQGESAPKNDAS